METFGASAPLNELQKRLGFDPGRIVATVTELLGESYGKGSDGKRSGGRMSAPSHAADREERFKQEAATKAVAFVRSGMRVGLGTGSTAIFATWRIAELLKAGTLCDIVGFATSKDTEAEAARLGIPLMPDELPHDLDVTIDGADEVDPELNLIKGGGGALLREKIAAQASRRVLIGARRSDRGRGLRHGRRDRRRQVRLESPRRRSPRAGARVAGPRPGPRTRERAQGRRPGRRDRPPSRPRAMPELCRR
jgi:hypothetical protein